MADTTTAIYGLTKPEPNASNDTWGLKLNADLDLIDTAINAASTSAWSTGDAKVTLKTTADSGWVMMNDSTIGSATSGAAARANADCQALFTLLFNNVVDADSPLFTSGGAGTTRATLGTAAAAWAANCRVTLTRQLGRSLAIAGSGASLTARALGHFDGNETHTQVTGELAAHTHGPGGASLFVGTTGALSVDPGAGAQIFTPTNSMATTASTGSGTPMDIMNPRSYWNIMIKL
jgi:hypothetical protein